MDEDWNADSHIQNQNVSPGLENLDLENNTNECSRVYNRISFSNGRVTGGDATQNSAETNGESGQLSISFEVVLESIDQSEKNAWINQLVMAVINRFGGRIPRGGWRMVHRVFNDKFQCNESEQQIKNIYNRIKSSLGTNNSNQDVMASTNNHGNIPEIKNVQLYKEICLKLNSNVIKFNEQNDAKERTAKVYSESMNNEIIDMINIAIRESSIDGRTNSLKDINNVLYACQKTYEEVTAKKKNVVPWKESIEKKIEQLEMDLNHLKQFDQNKCPSKEVKRICNKYRIHSNRAQSVEILCDQMFEKVARHKKRLWISENRKLFKKNNRNFEFNRKRFYREVEGEKLKVDESIDKEQTVEFWRDLWSGGDEPQYQEMLSFIEPILLNVDQEDDDLNKIIENTIKHLPSWKTPGHDYVYNFFIKRMTSLHPKLYLLIREAIKNPDMIDIEFYKGTTYLIAKKDNAISPKELRPITCLPNLYKLISKVATTLMGRVCDLNDVLSDNQMGTKKRCQGAKQQALINKNLNMSNEYNLKTSWIDIQKAYDSIDHNYLVFARDDQSLKEICWYVSDSLEKLGLKINQQKSASNIESAQVFGDMLDDEKGYKYLGILEDSRNMIKEENKQIIINKMVQRIKKLCETKLNGRNLFHAINEFALSTANYYIGIINFEPEDYVRLDVNIRKILKEYSVIRNSSNIDRLYLPRNELGRGLGNMAEKSELMLFNLNEYLLNSINYKAIIESEKAQATHLGTIKEFICRTYDIPEELLCWDMIKNKQKQRRMNRINEKALHKIVFQNDDGYIDIRQSSLWLSKGNVSPQEEGMMCKLQDRNLFWKKNKCPHCKRATATVDHLATHCGGLLNFDYKKRHNDVVRCIHMMFAKKYGITNQKRLKNYRVENVVSNERVRIKSDTPILTDNRIDHNKPDLLVHDLKTNDIWLIEVGITNKNILPNTEITKSRKYEMLSNELKTTFKANVHIIPIVITWDGLVTNYHKKHLKKIEVSTNIQAFIQTQVLKRTWESIRVDLREDILDVEYGQMEV
uniref:Uncharacterized protein LOC113798392 n=1 Tax=Dermatophagoides pteronyssinus TaxID=6956 RepID=A0A6P6YIM0_DERPT|nr:uncharacterized protein LOC113798392 [Dermatophagoides pteronyssinus]